jgi:hypothetical protein
MSYQWRIKAHSVTASNIILQVDFKRDTDADALPNSAENISFSTGTPLADIEADLNTRAKSKIDTYENDETTKEAAAKYLDKWTTVVAEEPKI